MNENFALAILTAISITCFAMMIDHARYKKVTNPQHLYRMCEQLIYDALVLSYQELTAYTLYLESQDTDNHTLDFALVNNRIKNQITIRYVVNKRMFNTDILDLSVNNHVLIQNGEQIYHTPVIEDIIPALTAFDPIRFNDQSHIHIDSIDRKNQQRHHQSTMVIAKWQ